MAHRARTHQELLRLLEQLEAAYGGIEDATLGADGERADEVARSAAPRPREIHERFKRAAKHAMDLGNMLGTGFGPTIKKTHVGEEYVMTNHEAATYTLRVFVLVLTAELEHFLREYARWWLTGGQLRRIRSARGPKRFKNLARADAKARLQAIEAVRPTAGAPHGWASRVAFVFGTRIDPPLRIAVNTLVHWRHEFAHRNNEPQHIDWSGKYDFAEAMITWYVATLGLANKLVARSNER